MPFYGSKGDFGAGRDNLVDAILAQQQGGITPSLQAPNIGPFAGDPSPPTTSGMITDYAAPPLPPPLQRQGPSEIQMPNWFSGGSGDWTRFLQRAGLDNGGDGGFGGTSGGVSGGDGGSPPGGSPPGGPPDIGSPPGGPPPGSTPQGDFGPVIGADLTAPGVDLSSSILGAPGMIGGTVSEPGTNPFGESFPGVTGTTGLIGSNVEVPQGFFSNTLGPGKGDLLSPEVLNALNQANINEPGGFSTAGMSLSDLAEAWGVGLDSAAALAEAGFADFGGGGFGGGGDAQEGGTGPSPGDLGEGPGEGGGGGGGGPPGAGDDDDSDGDGDF